MQHLSVVHYSSAPLFHIHILCLLYPKAKFTSKAAKFWSLMQYFEMCCNPGVAARVSTCRFFSEVLLNVSGRGSPWRLTLHRLQLPLSRFASSQNVAEVSQHSIPYWGKLRRSFLSLNLGFSGTDCLCFTPPVCCMQNTQPGSSLECHWGFFVFLCL